MAVSDNWSIGWTDVAQLDRRRRETGDPLGFRAAAMRAAPHLVPVFTRSCDHTRQLSLLCLILESAQTPDATPAEVRQRFLHGERLWLLAMARDAQGPAGAQVFSGLRWSKRKMHKAGPGDKFSIDEEAVAGQLSSGLWGRTRRAASDLGLVDAGGRSGAPEAVRLTSRGKELASATREALGDGGKLGSHAKKRTVTWEELASVFAPDFAHPDEPSEAERELIGAAMARCEHSEAFVALYATWTQHGLAPSMPKDELTLDQRKALAILRALDSLSNKIERPYRRWVSGDSEEEIDATSLAPRTVERHWIPLEEAGESELLQLRDALAKRPTLETVHAFHESRSADLGTPSWNRQMDPQALKQIRRYQRIETRLPSMTNLFNEHVAPMEAGT